MSKIAGVMLLWLCWGMSFQAAPTLNSQQKALIDAQLQQSFKKADANGDGFLDADELAHALRGPKAKPAPPMYDDKGSINPAFYQARTKYPDMIYLAAMDKDDDGRISWNEYRNFGETYAANVLGRQQAMQRAIQQALRNQARYLNRSTNYNRNRSSRYYHQNYNRAYHNAYNAQQQWLRNMQAAYRRQMQAQQNYVRQAWAARRSMYTRAVAMHHTYYRRR
jgi:hypothetical protein